MNLTLHIVRKDLWRLRGWLAGWIVVLLLPIAMGVRLLAGTPFDSPEAEAAWPLEWVQIFEVLFGYLLTILLLHEDRTIGTGQFWLTRPITRGRLFRAKAIGVFIILGLAPVIVSTPWWLWCRLTPGQIATAALELMVLGGLVAIPAALVATLTETTSRAVLWTTVLAAAGGTTLGFFVLQDNGRMDRLVPSAVAASVLVALAMLTVILRVFFTRRRTWWLLVAAGALPVLIAGSFAFGAKWAERRVAPKELNAGKAAGIAVKFEWARVYRWQGSVKSPDPAQRIGTGFSLEGVPAGFGLSLARGGQQTWRGSGLTVQRDVWRAWDAVIRWPWPLLDLRWPEPDPETEEYHAAWRKSRGMPPRTPSLDRHDFDIEAQLSRSLVARMQAEPPAYTAEFWLELLRPEKLWEMPLEPGRFSTAQGHSVRVERVVSRSDPLGPAKYITVAATSPVSLARTLNTMAHPDETPREHWAGPHLYAIQTQRRECMLLRLDGEHARVINGVRVAWRTLPLYPVPVRRGDRWAHRPGWADNLNLALLRLNSEAQFKREVRVDRLALEPPRGQNP